MEYTSVLNKARRGNLEALYSLYDSCKNKAYHLARLLTVDEKAAKKVTSHAFHDAIADVLSGKVGSEADFEALLTRKTISFSKSYCIHNNSKGFKVPQGKNFRIRPDEKSVTLGATGTVSVLKNLYPLLRFIYVIDELCDLSASKIADIFAITAENVETALSLKEENISYLASIVSSKSKAATYESVIADIKKDEEISGDIEQTIKAYIENAAKPIAQKEKSRRIRTGSIIAFIVIVALFVVCLVSAKYIGSDTEESSTSETSSEVDEEESESEDSE